jgi:hypothetical protein
MPKVPMKLCYLLRGYSKRRLACTAKANLLVTPRFVYVDELVRAEGREFVQIEVAQISIALVSYTLGFLLRSLNGG